MEASLTAGGPQNWASNVLIAFFEFRDNLKLFHFQTKSYAAHKAADTLEKSLSVLFDKFMESLQGQMGFRVTVPKGSVVRLAEFMSDNSRAVMFAQGFANVLDLIVGDAPSDVANIIAEMQANIHQFMYLLTFE